MSIIVSNCQHCDEQQFEKLSWVHITIFSVEKLGLFIRQLILDCILALCHSMSDHPKKMKFETAPPQILIKLYTLPLYDYNRRPVIFLDFFEK